jgi:hypothetical protein
MSTNIPPSSLDELQVPEEFYKIITDSYNFLFLNGRSIFFKFEK